MWPQLMSDRPNDARDSLRAPSGEYYGRRHGRQPGRSMSLYTRAAVSDVMRAAPLIAIGAGVAAFVAARRH
jgi:hypothetical protein